MNVASPSLRLGATDFQKLLVNLGPSLAMWRAAEIAALRQQVYEPPVLDLGCGDGIVASFVLPQIDIGVDPCPIAISRAAKRSVYRRLEARPIEALDIEPASIGTIVSNSVLEHISNLDQVLAAAARLLRPGGQLIFTTPTDAFTRWLALPLTSYGNWRNRHYEHRNLWPVTRWQQHLERAGFHITTSHSFLRRPLVTTWDMLELLQRIYIGRHRLFSLGWQRLPPRALERLANWAADIDFATPDEGGGRLIVARKRTLS